MAMDMLRTCYTSYMRLYRDDPDRLTLMRWAWCPDGALDLPFAHTFLSYTGDTFRDSGNYPIGEIPGIVGYSSGKISPRYKGLNFCGPEEWFQLGSPLSARGTPRVDGDGIPVCCSTTGPPLGGVLTSGEGTFSTGVGPRGHGHGHAVAAVHGHGTGHTLPVAKGHGHGHAAAQLHGHGTGHTPPVAKGHGHGLAVAALVGSGHALSGAHALGSGAAVAAAQLHGHGTGKNPETAGHGAAAAAAALIGGGMAFNSHTVGHGAAAAVAALVGGGTAENITSIDGHGHGHAAAALVAAGTAYSGPLPVGDGAAVAAAQVKGEGTAHIGFVPVSYTGDTVSGSAILTLDGPGPWPGIYVGMQVTGAGISPSYSLVFILALPDVYLAPAAAITTTGALYTFS